MENQLNISSTCATPFWVLGFCLFPNNTSADTTNDLYSSQELFAIESEYNAPMESSTDKYLETTYNIISLNEESKYSSIEYSLLDLAQKLSEEQAVLEPDFSEALDALYYSKRKQKPTKTRF